jgi:hypothetical protein
MNLSSRDQRDGMMVFFIQFSAVFRLGTLNFRAHGKHQPEEFPLKALSRQDSVTLHAGSLF